MWYSKSNEFQYSTLSMKKSILIGLLILGITLLLASIFGPDFLEGKLKTALEAQVVIQTDSSYTMEFQELDISLWGRRVTADSISISPKNDRETIKSIQIRSFEIQEIKWLSLITEDFPQFGKVIVEQPEIEIYSRPFTSSTFSNNSSSDGDSSSNSINFSNFDLNIIDGKARMVEPSGRTEVMLEHFDLSATKVNVNQILDGSRVPFLDELILSGKNLTWRLDEKLYRLEVGAFSFDRVQKQALVQNIALIPVLPRYRFSEIKGYSSDRVELNIDKINLQGVNLDSLYIPRIEVEKISIEQGALAMFKNKTIPSKTTIGFRPLLSEAISKATVAQVGLHEVLINNFDVTYTEHKEGVKEPGEITFEDISGSIKNISTPGYPTFLTDSLELDVSTYFMGVSKLDLKARYALFDKDEHHRVWGSLGSIHTSALKSPLINLASIEAKSGQVNSLEFNFNVNRTAANGQILLDYQDLNIFLLKDYDTSQKPLASRVSSFIANTFIIDDSNTGSKIEPAKIHYKWDNRKGIFGYWWQALLSGIKATIK